MNLDFTGKNAVVCGSTQGIGFAIASELAESGANVTLVARNKERLEDCLSKLKNSGSQKHQFVQADFSEPEVLKIKLEEYVSANDPVNILINNTGGPAAGPANMANMADFQAAFSMHLMCNHVLMQSFKQGMIDSGYGRIINIISTSVKAPLNNLGVSNTIRGAVANWSKTLANELGVYGITVNNVLPGATKTARLTQILENKVAKTGCTMEEAQKGMLGPIPLNRFAEPEEVANAAVFLASPAGAYINGINVPVDGGRTASL